MNTLAGPEAGDGAAVAGVAVEAGAADVEGLPCLVHYLGSCFQIGVRVDREVGIQADALAGHDQAEAPGADRGHGQALGTFALGALVWPERCREPTWQAGHPEQIEGVEARGSYPFGAQSPHDVRVLVNDVAALGQDTGTFFDGLRRQSGWCQIADRVKLTCVGHCNLRSQFTLIDNRGQLSLYFACFKYYCLILNVSMLPNATIDGGNVYVFIDSSNLWSVQKSKQRTLDYSKLLTALKTIFKAKNIQVYFYTAYPEDGTRSYALDGKHKFFTFLQKGLKFVVRKKPLKRITTIHGGDLESIQEKGNMDVEMTIDAVHFQHKYDTAVFLTGDSDFLALISYLRNVGKKVYVFSSKNSVSQELRTGSDGYFDLLLIPEDIWGNELRHRKQSD